VNDDNARWKVYYAHSFNANSATPEFRIGEVTEPDHYIHGSNISEMGLNPTGGSNRNLIDYFQISFDPLGAAVVAYTDDHNDFDGNTYVAPPNQRTIDPWRQLARGGRRQRPHASDADSFARADGCLPAGSARPERRASHRLPGRRADCAS
jgi:hypothetical protein